MNNDHKMERIINENEANHRKYISDLKRKANKFPLPNILLQRPSSSPASSNAPPPPSRPGSNHRSSNHEGPNHQGPNHRDSFVRLLSALVGLLIVPFDSLSSSRFSSARADFVGAVLPDLSFRHRFVSRNAARPPNCAQALERDRNRGRGVPRPRVLVRNAHELRNQSDQLNRRPSSRAPVHWQENTDCQLTNSFRIISTFLSVLDHSD